MLLTFAALSFLLNLWLLCLQTTQPRGGGLCSSPSTCCCFTNAGASSTRGRAARPNTSRRRQRRLFSRRKSRHKTYTSQAVIQQHVCISSYSGSDLDSSTSASDDNSELNTNEARDHKQMALVVSDMPQMTQIPAVKSSVPPLSSQLIQQQQQR